MPVLPPKFEESPSYITRGQRTQAVLFFESIPPQSIEPRHKKRIEEIIGILKESTTKKPYILIALRREIDDLVQHYCQQINGLPVAEMKEKKKDIYIRATDTMLQEWIELLQDITKNGEYFKLKTLLDGLQPKYQPLLDAVEEEIGEAMPHREIVKEFIEHYGDKKLLDNVQIGGFQALKVFHREIMKILHVLWRSERHSEPLREVTLWLESNAEGFSSDEESDEDHGGNV